MLRDVNGVKNGYFGIREGYEAGLYVLEFKKKEGFDEMLESSFFVKENYEKYY